MKFHTGGSGLAPGSTYKGFYYSADDIHIPFQGADVPMENWGDEGRWSDGTDNHGTSQRIRENFFWFEASFSCTSLVWEGLAPPPFFSPVNMKKLPIEGSFQRVEKVYYAVFTVGAGLDPPTM